MARVLKDEIKAGRREVESSVCLGHHYLSNSQGNVGFN
ncbi:hypothetical protein VpaChn25_2044 [Vibrio parahaemolyticus]|nr:hypothetical protein VpaChn25_2044 [Vibrio parahaemolyticus]EXJ35773.1 hypothetical protein D050_1170 [Vibrio parahaemolyticus VPCR-2009]